VDTASQWAGSNRGLLGIDAQNNQGGRDWMDVSRFALGAAQGGKDLFSGAGNTDKGKTADPNIPGSSTGTGGSNNRTDDPQNPFYGVGDTNNPNPNPPTPGVSTDEQYGPPNDNYMDYVFENGTWVYRPGQGRGGSG
jgi:hypothetical protein